VPGTVTTAGDAVLRRVITGCWRTVTSAVDGGEVIAGPLGGVPVAAAVLSM
jgi:hypothetical protein